jgi:hypothetical protein
MYGEIPSHEGRGWRRRGAYGSNARESSDRDAPGDSLGWGTELFGGVTDALKQDWLLTARSQRAGNNNVWRSL